MEKTEGSVPSPYTLIFSIFLILLCYILFFNYLETSPKSLAKSLAELEHSAFISLLQAFCAENTSLSWNQQQFMLATKRILHIPDSLVLSELQTNSRNPLLTKIATMNQEFVSILYLSDIPLHLCFLNHFLLYFCLRLLSFIRSYKTVSRLPQVTVQQNDGSLSFVEVPEEKFPI